jgi:ATP-dependent Clp protease ATP-binding subunit ClpA
VFERYTEASRRAIFFAREEARQRGATDIATSDLFLGIIREPAEKGSAVASLHARAAEFRAMFGVEPKLKKGQTIRDLPLSNSSKRALAYAAQEAERKKLWAITRDLLLRGVLRTNDETVTKLQSAGVALDTLVSTTSSEKSSGLPMTRGRGSYELRKLLRRYGLIVLAILFAAAILYLHSQN